MNIKLEKMKVQKMKMDAALGELKFKVLERMEDIDRIKKSIVTQEESIEILSKEINLMEE